MVQVELLADRSQEGLRLACALITGFSIACNQLHASGNFCGFVLNVPDNAIVGAPNVRVHASEFVDAICTTHSWLVPIIVPALNPSSSVPAPFVGSGALPSLASFGLYIGRCTILSDSAAGKLLPGKESVFEHSWSEGASVHSEKK